MSSALVSRKETSVDVRKGSPSSRLDRAEFEARFLSQFADPLFSTVAQELRAIVATAWDAYNGSRKAPRTRKAGPEFADPDYDLAVDWSETRDAIRAAEQNIISNQAREFFLSTGHHAMSTLVQVRSRSHCVCWISHAKNSAPLALKWRFST